MTQNTTHLVWIDLEMTGLRPESDRILEIATVVTDSRLKILAKGPVFAIHQPEEVLKKMDSWNVEQHTKSGLLERVRPSDCTESEAEQKTLEFIKEYVPTKTSPLCGNSICLDRRFLYQYMPALEQYFHYRNLDVSTVKELAYRWAPHLLHGFVKKGAHLAMDDILESIEELKFYKHYFFQLVGEPQ